MSHNKSLKFASRGSAYVDAHLPIYCSILNIGHVLSNVMARTTSLDIHSTREPVSANTQAVTTHLTPEGAEQGASFTQIDQSQSAMADAASRPRSIGAISTEQLARLLKMDGNRTHSVSAATSTNATCNTTPSDSPAGSPRLDRAHVGDVLPGGNLLDAGRDESRVTASARHIGSDGHTETQALAIAEHGAGSGSAAGCDDEHANVESEHDIDKTLIHGLFVEIAAVADQLQSGACAKDMRYMLKLIFEMYADSEPVEQNPPAISDARQTTGASPQDGSAGANGDEALHRSAAQLASAGASMRSASSSQGTATPAYATPTPAAAASPNRSNVLIKRPSWRADDAAPICTRCGLSFTLVR